ncbi:MAG TPA: HlyD family efflux transporter periplasmic adaptor subunit [Thermoanaerobaculia bacterium]|jgi:multidrug resistance efflux pump|nr:HlyD family efflux transporter periplasmic adaptor subunit [Thermoanaerobaculia bacterium]
MDRIRTKSKAAQWKRPAFVAAVVAALISAGVALANIDFSTRRVDSTTVTVDTVRRGTMEIKVAANGQLLPRHIEQLAAEVPGRVAKADVKPGTFVNVGAVLVELENPQLTAAADEAQSAYEGAIAELQAAEAELQTNMLNQEVVLTQVQFNAEKAKARTDADEALASNGLISGIELKRSQLHLSQLRRTAEIESHRLRKVRDNIQVQLAVRRSRVTQLARALERVRAQAADLTIVAGISGIVQAIDVQVGQQLQPGNPIGRIAQQEQLYAELRVPAREATQVRAGQHVVVDTRNGLVNGIVTRVDPGVTEGTVIVDVDLRGPLPAGTRPQLEVEGTIFIAQLAGTLYVTRPSYVKSDAAIAVYKLEPAGRYATRTTIKAGQVSLDHMQVLQGLHPGDRIVTSEIAEWQGQERILLK